MTSKEKEELKSLFNELMKFISTVNKPDANKILERADEIISNSKEKGGNGKKAR